MNWKASLIEIKSKAEHKIMSFRNEKYQNFPLTLTQNYTLLHSQTIQSLKEPCPGCAAPYGYHNVMRLSTDTRQFSVSRICETPKKQSKSLEAIIAGSMLKQIYISHYKFTKKHSSAAAWNNFLSILLILLIFSIERIFNSQLKGLPQSPQLAPHFSPNDKQ